MARILDPKVVAHKWANVLTGAGSVKSITGMYTACNGVTDLSVV